VLVGNEYGPTGAEYTGTLDPTFPAESDVREGIEYGLTGSEFTGTLIVDASPYVPPEGQFDQFFVRVAPHLIEHFGESATLDGDPVNVIVDEDTLLIDRGDHDTQVEQIRVWLAKSVLPMPRAGLRLVRGTGEAARGYLSTGVSVDDGDAWEVVFERAIPRQFGDQRLRH
jgi:hypothetical protein